MFFQKFTRAALTGAVFALGATGIAQAAELRLADFLPPTHPYQENVYGVMGQMIEEATGGDVTLKVFPGGALGGNPVEQYDRALNGVAEISFGLPGYTASKFPMTLLTELPGLIEEETGTQQVWGAIDFLKAEHKRVHMLALWTNGENVLYTRDKPVRSLADVQGMKIRVPSANAGAMVEAWGAVPVSMPVPEVYNAMQTGVLDAVLIDSTATYAFRFGEVAKYVTSGMKTTISPFVLFMNKDTYEGLSAEYQAEMDRIGAEISVIANGVQLAGTARGETMFREMDEREWIDLTPEAAAEFDAISERVAEELLDAAEADGLPARAFAAALSN